MIFSMHCRPWFELISIGMGSIHKKKHGLVAQVVEHAAVNRGVQGSSPCWADFCLRFALFFFRCVFSVYVCVHINVEFCGGRL